jgi:diamine N-acetyltransferase
MKDILKNKSILLRALEKEDLDFLYKWENNTEVWKLSNTLIPFSKYTLDEYIESSRKDIYEARQLRLIIEQLETNLALGTIDLVDFDPYNLRAGIGILIAEEGNRRKGYASESLDTLINYCSEILDLKQLYCNILENNSESLNLFVSKGFTITGVKKEWIRIKDQWMTEFFLQKILR